MRKAVFSLFPLQTYGSTFSWWENFPKRISEYLGKHGVEHFCLYRGNNKLHISDFGKCEATKAHLQSTLWVLRNLYAKARKFNKAIFHTHAVLQRNGLWIVNKIFNNNFRWVMTDHDSWESIKFSLTKKIVRKSLRSVGYLPEIVLGCSESSMERLRNIYGSRNVSFIYNGIDMPNIILPKRASGSPRKAIFIGRLIENKGLWVLLHAFSLLMKRQIGATLTIVGSGPLYEPMREYVKNNNLAKIVEFVGHQSDISKLMLNSDFVIIPSVWEENCPIVSLEAQAHYLPAIYSNSGGLPETQINGRTGIMVSKNSSEGIVKAIQALQNDVEMFEEMRLDARKNAENFTLDKMAENYCNLYLELFDK
ncbi:MAG: glycosyltransferase family 4 protein [Candidatus Omnitrophota bacterium]